ncbi:MAG TPA: hypothetical protein VIW64_17230 [Pyrinomonadaceae bacterium]|jgi:hypothetical protein
MNLQHYGGVIELALQKVKYSLRGRFSHADEQRILARLIEKLLPHDWPRTVVDIGAGNGVRWSNSYALLLSGWKALGIEADPRKYALLKKAYGNFARAEASNTLADPQNVGGLLRQFEVEKNFGVLCLDIDGNDYWVLDAILSEFRPGLVVTEINENIPPPFRFAVKFDPDFQLRYHFYGYSIAALEDLCRKHNYGILELEYNNAFIAPAELAAADFLPADAVYKQGYLNRPERRQRFAANVDMEAVHSLTPQEGMRFLQDFYAADAGNYYLAADEETFSNLIEQTALAGG